MLVLAQVCINAQTKDEITLFKTYNASTDEYYFMPSSYVYEEHSVEQDKLVLGIAPSIVEKDGKINVEKFMVSFTRNKYFTAYNIMIIQFESGEKIIFKSNNKMEEKLIFFPLNEVDKNKEISSLRSFNIRRIWLMNNVATVADIHMGKYKNYFVNLYKAIDAGRIVISK